MLIRGNELNEAQRRLVLAAFGYRWTTDNKERATRWLGRAGGVPRIPLVTDDQWLKDHAFHFVKDGSRMMATRHHAEPAYMADDPGQNLLNRTGIPMPQ